MNLFGDEEGALLSLLPEEDLKRSFISAKMTIKNEMMSQYRYQTLNFVEFLDFMCRVIICYKSGKCDFEWNGKKHFHDKLKKANTNTSNTINSQG